jgi:hypothetical protein
VDTEKKSNDSPKEYKIILEGQKMYLSSEEATNKE